MADLIIPKQEIEGHKTHRGVELWKLTALGTTADGIRRSQAKGTAADGKRHGG